MIFLECYIVRSKSAIVDLCLPSILTLPTIDLWVPSITTASPKEQEEQTPKAILRMPPFACLFLCGMEVLKSEKPR